MKSNQNHSFSIGNYVIFTKKHLEYSEFFELIFVVIGIDNLREDKKNIQIIASANNTIKLWVEQESLLLCSNNETLEEITNIKKTMQRTTEELIDGLFNF